MATRWFGLGLRLVGLNHPMASYLRNQFVEVSLLDHWTQQWLIPQIGEAIASFEWKQLIKLLLSGATVAVPTGQLLVHLLKSLATKLPGDPLHDIP